MVAGCGPGYTALLLGKLFNEVLGMDFSGRLLDVALQFQMGLVAVCGDQKVELLLSNDSIATSNVTFKQVRTVVLIVKDGCMQLLYWYIYIQCLNHVYIVDMVS